MANKTIYIWGYNGHKKLDENSPERYFSIPQKFTSHSHQPQAESKLLNSAVNKILVTVKGKLFGTSSKCIEQYLPEFILLSVTRVAKNFQPLKVAVRSRKKAPKLAKSSPNGNIAV